MTDRGAAEPSPREPETADRETSERRPPWWPGDEAWPPRDWDAMRRVRRRAGRRGSWRGPPWHENPGWAASGGQRWRRGPMARNFGCLVVLLATLVTSIGVLVLWLLATLLGTVAATGPLADLARAAGLVVLLAGALALIFGLRLVRSVGGPLGHLVDAAGRIQDGDLSARVVEPRGPRDLTAVTRAFNTMASGLESEDERRRRLLADLGHELRTPLTVIQGHLEAMLDGVHPPDAEHLAIVLDETHVLERLIGDLRTLSLADAGTLPLHREPADLDQLLAETAAAFEPRARSGGVRFVVDAEPGVAPIDLDPVRFREVLGNLVENALRYSPRDAAVTLAARRREDGSVVVSVADEGPGLPEELRDGVFERFTKTAESPGSGLGLAIARAIVEAHGGTIGASPGPRAGTVVAITLPAAAQGTRITA